MTVAETSPRMQAIARPRITRRALFAALAAVGPERSRPLTATALRGRGKRNRRLDEKGAKQAIRNGYSRARDRGDHSG